MSTQENPLDLSTVAGARRARRTKPRRVAGFTVLTHPDPRRVGDRFALVGLGSSQPVAVSRLEPHFESADGRRSHPLADRHLSREPAFRIVRDPRLRLVPGPRPFALDGRAVTGPVEVTPELLHRSVVVTLADRVALLLHELSVPLGRTVADFGLTGVSDPIQEVHREIRRVADLHVPVLLQGETGTGKELVARALHAASTRAGAPFVAVNMAALSPTLAAAELFGAARGAFTGADRSRPGLIREASGGTLFLDEIGAMPSDVQVLLLRFLEDRVVRAVGAEKGEAVDVRVVAATDTDLDRAVEAGDFSRPLLQRVAGYEIRLPPLRERLGDLGLLLQHFLSKELEELGRVDLLDDPGAGHMPWLPAELFLPLSRHRWPGNVRELRNFALRLAVRHHQGEIPIDEVARGLDGAGAEDASAELDQPVGEAASAEYRAPTDATDDEIEDAMARAGWAIKKAASLLGMSRPSLYKRIDAHPTLCTAASLQAVDIERAIAARGKRLEDLADHLRVSQAALRARMQALGIEPSS